MEMLKISAEKANYVPTKINATAVSGAGEDPNGATAEEIVAGLLGRKIFAAIPNEMTIGLHNASRNGDTVMYNRIMDSLNNLRGSTLLKLQSEAEEGSLMQKIVNEKIEAFKKEFGEPIPNYTPYIPPKCPNTVIIKGLTMHEHSEKKSL
jgi:citrate lyase alpha subunit